MDFLEHWIIRPYLGLAAGSLSAWFVVHGLLPWRRRWLGRAVQWLIPPVLGIVAILQATSPGGVTIGAVGLGLLAVALAGRAAVGVESRWRTWAARIVAAVAVLHAGWSVPHCLRAAAYVAPRWVEPRVLSERALPRIADEIREEQRARRHDGHEPLPAPQLRVAAQSTFRVQDVPPGAGETWAVAILVDRCPVCRVVVVDDRGIRIALGEIPSAEAPLATPREINLLHLAMLPKPQGL